MCRWLDVYVCEWVGDCVCVCVCVCGWVIVVLLYFNICGFTYGYTFMSS